MTVKMFEGCWGNTREGEIKGPYTEKKNVRYPRHCWFAPEDDVTDAVTEEGFVDYGDDGDNDIIEVYPSDPRVKSTPIVERNDLMKLQPIETAPKDGTFILLFGESGFRGTPLRCQVGYYEKGRNDHWRTHDGDSFLDDGGPPIYWMPLPEAPKIITLPDWVPEGWWVATNENNHIALYLDKPRLEKERGEEGYYYAPGGGVDLTSKRSDFSPEYLALPWDQSCVQKVKPLCEERDDDE